MHTAPTTAGAPLRQHSRQAHAVERALGVTTLTFEEAQAAREQAQRQQFAATIALAERLFIERYGIGKS